MSVKNQSTNESLYNQYLSDEEIRDLIRTYDTEEAYSVYTNEEVEIGMTDVGQVRSHLHAVEAKMEEVWDVVAEMEGTGAEGSTDDYIVYYAPHADDEIDGSLLAAEQDPMCDLYDGDEKVCIDVLKHAIERVAEKLSVHDAPMQDFVVPLPEGKTLEDVKEARSDA